MDRPIRLGVAGTGKLGAIHAKLAAATEGADLVGVHDIDQTRANEIAETHGVRAFSTLEEMLGEIDGCLIVTPTSTHLDVARRAISAGVDCFVEKPVTASSAEGKELRQIVSGTDRVIQVGHVERFNPAVIALGTIPPPLFIEAHRLARFSPRATDVAVVFDLMIHDIDLVLSMLPGEEVKEIRASGVPVLSNEIDIANARIEFSGGCTVNLTASRISRNPMRKMRLFGPQSYISLDFGEPSAEVFSITAPVEGGTAAIDERMKQMLGEIDAGTQRGSISYQRPTLPEINPIGREIELFVEAIRHRTPPPVTLDDGYRAVEIAEEIVRLVERK